MRSPAEVIDSPEGQVVAWPKCRCGLTHDPSPDGLPPLTSESVIGDEVGEVLWLPGHVGDRDLRRRLLAGSDWCQFHNFVGLVKAARSYIFVWMRRESDRGKWHQCPTEEKPCGGWWEDCARPDVACSTFEECLASYLRCDHGSPDSQCKPWTRIEVPLGTEYEVF